MLRVVLVLQRIDQPNELTRHRFIDPDQVLGLHRQLGDTSHEAARLDLVLRRVKGLDRRVDVVAVLLDRKILGFEFQRQLDQRLLVDPGLLHRFTVEREEAPPVEHPGDAAVLAEVSAVLGEQMPHFGHGPVPVVRQRLDQDRDPAGAVALVGDLLVGHALEFPGPLLDRPVDVVPRHVVGLRLRQRVAQPGIARRIAATEPGRYDNLLEDACEDLAAFGVLRRLLVLDRAPLAVTGHEVPSVAVCGNLAALCCAAT